MRIDILAIGSQGDVRPHVALGLGLQTAGHRVRLVTLGGFEEFARGYGLDHLAIAGSPQELASTAEGRDWVAQRGSTIGFLRGFVRVARSVIEQGIANYWGACGDVELLVVSSMGLAVGVHIAERLGIPMVRTNLSPFTPTHYDWNGHRSLLTAVRGNMTAVGGAGFRFLIWRQLRHTTNVARLNVLGLPPLALKEPFGSLDRKRVPVLDGYSPTVIARPPDWGDWIHVTGYWFLDSPVDWAAPRELVDFLAAGPPPVFVGFGSTPFPNPGAATELVVRALGSAGQRGVIVAGGSGLATGRLTEDVLSLDAVPHGWLFPQVCAAVHHGGAGVTGAALRAGLPSVVVPVFADQPFWGSRVFELGAGPRPIPAKRLTADTLARAIDVSLKPNVQRRAATLGEHIRAEHGVVRAVAAIHDYIGAAHHARRAS